MLSKVLGTSFNQGAALAIVALIVGAITGWIGIGSGNTIESITKVARFGYFSLVFILPGALLFLTWSYTQVKPDVYSSQGYSLVLSFLAATGGSFIASLTFLVALTNVPAVFGKQDPVILNEALLKTIGWSYIGIIVGIMSIVGLALGFWANGKVSNIQ